MKDLRATEIMEMIKTLTHSEIIALRESLKESGNRNHNLRPLHYDYTNQVWID